MSSRHVGDVLSLVRQGLTVGVQFGTHSVEALLWVAETVEEGVYEPHSLRRTPTGIAFALDNPLLRVGAFTSLRLLVNREVIPGDRVRLRLGPGSPWRTAASIVPGTSLSLRPGDRTEVEIDGVVEPAGEVLTVRIELHTPAIPPRVWFEFDDSPTEVELEP